MSVFTTLAYTFPVAPTVLSVTQSPGANYIVVTLSYPYPRGGTQEGFGCVLWCKDKPGFRSSIHVNQNPNPDSFTIGILTACDYVIDLNPHSYSLLGKATVYVFTTSQPSG